MAKTVLNLNLILFVTTYLVKRSQHCLQKSAVKLVIEEGFSVKEVRLQLEVHANSWYRRIQEVEKYGEVRFMEKGAHFLMPIMK
ncbi:hypothetical protein SOQ11_002415 [Enterococcus faecalis]|nr:hypothetical protein [Enterococcus faecalis]